MIKEAVFLSSMICAGSACACGSYGEGVGISGLVATSWELSGRGGSPDVSVLQRFARNACGHKLKSVQADFERQGYAFRYSGIETVREWGGWMNTWKPSPTPFWKGGGNIECRFIYDKQS